ncbi:hypothetical protein EYF80_046724 [Liparis tanakae]|uniref:Uncharacterized protein n=1 Tax=Liparis tanakae TaxID=230148 RepID=A0A4Z2FQD8_9TELE|nr:hypothetical protein EYF80_046724 [Liparis tanakae]
MAKKRKRSASRQNESYRGEEPRRATYRDAESKGIRYYRLCCCFKKIKIKKFSVTGQGAKRMRATCQLLHGSPHWYILRIALPLTGSLSEH